LFVYSSTQLKKSQWGPMFCQNIFCCVPRKKENYTGLKRFEGEEKMHFFF